jgi:2-desacetyl-2-hydroxyethyl bacteriochlorophyllide A dehydrogenase
MENILTRSSIFFQGDSQIEVVNEKVSAPGPHQVLVQAIVSGISAGTEMLIYRGQIPKGMAIDATIEALAGEISYPLKYGYAMVGMVKKLGAEVEPSWRDRSVFAFHPHESHFLTSPDSLIPLPVSLAPQDAVFTPNMETAVTFLLDGRPLIGERVAVFGQGVVGLLTTALLSRMSLASLVTLDPIPARRRASLQMGAGASLDPQSPDLLKKLETHLGGPADLVYELSGQPATLNQAIGITGYSGRIVVGSWYGTKRAEIDLGGSFHRNRIELISSQVSSLAPALQGRWDKSRRMNLALETLGAVNLAPLITQQIPIARATEAYRLLDRSLEKTIQVILTYPQG